MCCFYCSYETIRINKHTHKEHVNIESHNTYNTKQYIDMFIFGFNTIIQQPYLDNKKKILRKATENSVIF